LRVNCVSEKLREIDPEVFICLSRSLNLDRPRGRFTGESVRRLLPDDWAMTHPPVVKQVGNLDVQNIRQPVEHVERDTFLSSQHP